MTETNKIYRMDCLEGLKRLPDSCVDLIMTDPPYLIKDPYAGGRSGLARSIQPINDRFQLLHMVQQGPDSGLSGFLCRRIRLLLRYDCLVENESTANFPQQIPF